MTEPATNNVPSQPKLSRLFKLQWEPAQDSYVLLYPEGMVKLNQSAAEILKRCDGERDGTAIANDIESSFALTSLQADVDQFLSVASERGWVV
jgi:pyrroloquinoline quinone biosynthesis protein D